MERDFGTINALRALGYTSSVCVRRCTCDELPCPLLTWLESELRATCSDLEDRKTGAFLVEELRTLLTELFCPYATFTTETLTTPLLNKATEFMISELQAARMIQHKVLHPEDETNEVESGKEQRGEDQTIDDLRNWCLDNDGHELVQGDCKAETKRELSLLLHALNMEESSMLTDVCLEVEKRLADLPSGDMTDPLLDSQLNMEQWRQLQKINEALVEDYQCRRQMMVIRFQVTLQSFAWGEKEQMCVSTEMDFVPIFTDSTPLQAVWEYKMEQPLLTFGSSLERSKMLASIPPMSTLALVSQVSLSLLLAARKDQSYILPVKAGESTAVYKVLMGSVPDRGGRPGELEAPMPMWEGRREGGKGCGGPRGGRGQHRQRFSGKKRNKQD